MEIALLSSIYLESRKLFREYCCNIADLWLERKEEFDVKFFNRKSDEEFRQWVIEEQLHRVVGETFFDVYLAIDKDNNNFLASFVIFGKSGSLAEDPKVKSNIKHFKPDTIGQIRTAVTAKHYEGQGYAKLLLQVAVKEMANKGFKGILADHHGKNEKMKALLKKTTFDTRHFKKIYDGHDLERREREEISGLKTLIYLLNLTDN